MKKELDGLLQITDKDVNALWEYLKTNYLQDINWALSVPDTGAKDLYDLIVEETKLLKLLKSAGVCHRPSGRGKAETVEVALADHEGEYVEFLSWYLAEQANKLD
ncbi:MAG: hypothetical protein M3157_06785 [Actinomycetota bacterium]|nr:hypothetical protein [Actinomycetota bacterium]